MNIECDICVEHLQSSNALSSTPCGHVFHQQCLMEWLGRRQTCPQCRCYVTAATTRPIYPNFCVNEFATIRNLEQRIVDLQCTLEIKDTELVASRSTNQTLKAKVESQVELVRQYETLLNQLKVERYQLNSQLISKTEDAKITLEWLKVKEEKIRLLEDRAKIDKEASKVKIERLREQQHNLIEELTAKCSALEKFKRTLGAKLEKRVNEMTALQTSRAVTEQPGPSTKPPSKAKRVQRKVLSTIDSNTDTQAAGGKPGYSLRPRTVDAAGNIQQNSSTNPNISRSSSSSKRSQTIHRNYERLQDLAARPCSQY